jgi:bacterioferritin
MIHEITSVSSERLIEGLNEAFNREIATAVRYMLQGSAIKGLQNEPLRQMYRSEMADEIRHAQYLADKIVMLGGVPKVETHVPKPPVLISDMIQQDLAAEHRDIAHYAAMARLAEEAGDPELKLRMEEQAADETRHAEQLQRMRGAASV